ncbi:MAG: single-stranded DNA-binding protein [Cellulomonadaceae bacterium]
MTIPTRQSLVGVITSRPRCSFTADGGLRFYARVKVRSRRANPDGTPGGWVNSYHNLVAYGMAAYRARSRVRENDAVVASGYTRTYTHQRNGHMVLDEEFVAEAFGHEATRTEYRIVRTSPAQRARRPATRRAKAPDRSTATA